MSSVSEWPPTQAERPQLSRMRLCGAILAPGMNTRKIVIRTALVLIALLIVLVLLAFGFFYSVFYFPNWTAATTHTITSSGEKREYLLYVPKSYDRAKPTALVITLHTSMSWDNSAMAISQWNSVAFFNEHPLTTK